MWNNISSCFWDMGISGAPYVWRSSMWEQVDDQHLAAYERALEKEFLRLSSLFILKNHSITLRICTTRREKGKQNRKKKFCGCCYSRPMTLLSDFIQPGVWLHRSKKRFSFTALNYELTTLGSFSFVLRGKSRIIESNFRFKCFY